jgi:hypothetical protein
MRLSTRPASRSALSCAAIGCGWRWSSHTICCGVSASIARSISCTVFMCLSIILAARLARQGRGVQWWPQGPFTRQQGAVEPRNGTGVETTRRSACASHVPYDTTFRHASSPSIAVSRRRCPRCEPNIHGGSSNAYSGLLSSAEMRSSPAVIRSPSNAS